MTRKWRQTLCAIFPGHKWTVHDDGKQLIPTRTCNLCGRQESRLPNFDHPEREIWVLTDPYDSQPKY